MGLSEEAQCGCGYAQGKKVPRCSGQCIVQCWNVWGSRNFWPQECMGENLCTYCRTSSTFVVLTCAFCMLYFCTFIVHFVLDCKTSKLYCTLMHFEHCTTCTTVRIVNFKQTGFN